MVVVADANHSIPGLEFLLQDRATNQVTRRKQVARAMRIEAVTMPAVLDTDEGQVSGEYFAWPGRLVVVRPDGTIAFDAGSIVNPGWDTTALDLWLEHFLVNSGREM